MFLDRAAEHVELQAVPVLAVPQVEGRVRRDVEQLRVLLPPLHPVVRPDERSLVIVRNMLVELDVLIVRDLALRTGPKSACLINCFCIH